MDPEGECGPHVEDASVGEAPVGGEISELVVESTAIRGKADQTPARVLAVRLHHADRIARAQWVREHGGIAKQAVEVG